MSKKISGVVALVGMCALSLFLLNCGSSSSRPSGVLYVLTQGINTTTGLGNNVSSFTMNFDNGYLSLVNSNATTCPTTSTGSNPTPCGAPLQIELDPAGANAFVLNQGVPCVIQGTTCVPQPGSSPVAPSIYPYTVNSDGSLTAASSGLIYWTPCLTAPCNPSSTIPANIPFPDTATAMVLDPAGQFLFVIDQGSYPQPGYPTPSLVPTNPPYASCPHHPTAATDVCPSISVFQVSSTNLTLASGSPFYLSKIPTALSAITFTPPGSSTSEELLFVTNNEDICSFACIFPSPHNDNTVSVYAVSSSGVLNEQPNSPYAIAAPDPISVMAVNTNPAGEKSGGVFVYVGNQGATVGALNPFQLCTVQNANCSPSAVLENLLVPVTCAAQSCSPAAGLNPIQMVVDPTNNFLYSIAELSNQVYGFRINPTTGTLSPLSPPSLQTGTQPVSMALHPTVNNTGQFLYISNTVSDNISGFTLSTTTGSMSSPITVISPATPSGLAAH